MSRPHTPAYTPRQSRAQPSYQSASRSGTPLASKSVITLEEWERLAPLDDSQLQSINVVKERFAERPLPENVCVMPYGSTSVELMSSWFKQRPLHKGHLVPSRRLGDLDQ